MQSSRHWFVYTNEKQHGPYNDEQLATLVQEHKITPETLLRLDGGNEWRESKEVNGLWDPEEVGNPRLLDALFIVECLFAGLFGILAVSAGGNLIAGIGATIFVLVALKNRSDRAKMPHYDRKFLPKSVGGILFCIACVAVMVVAVLLAAR
ncbi:DUF4339 domain-containing protein [Aeoliella sp.]|uniref:DUF4339 domain-containing protein n=1 Tax=Aeoliella sp. TaxID=2795800 RepID=UPI003CCC1434